jgi:hypothetical protein
VASGNQALSKAVAASQSITLVPDCGAGRLAATTVRVAGHVLAITDPLEPLRLNRLVLSRLQPGAASGATLQQRLLDQLLALCPPWDMTGRQFLRRYFGYLQREIERNRPAIEARLSRFHGLYAADDTLFSAPAPLPGADLILPDGQEPVATDFAFWLGGTAAVVLVGPSKLRPSASRRRLERLAAAGLSPIAFGQSGGAEQDDALFGSLLGSATAAFFDAEKVPCGPLHGDFPGNAFLKADQRAAISMTNKENSQ